MARRRYQHIIDDIRHKYHFTRGVFYKLLFIVGMICSPWIVSMIYASSQSAFDQAALDSMPIDRKWDMVRRGMAKLKCEDYAPDTIDRHGLDPRSLDGINYAIDLGVCKFIPTVQLCDRKLAYFSNPCKPHEQSEDNVDNEVQIPNKE